MTEVAQSPTFGGITATQPQSVETGGPDFSAIHASAEFAELRRRFRAFVFPMTVLFFLWYLTYVLLAAYAGGFMSHRLVGSVNVALVLGLLQFASTIAITNGYRRYARRRLDPQALLVRARAEAGA